MPVLVGALNSSSEAQYGKIFAPYLQDPGNFFIISSDFCHWGKRFSYTYIDGGVGAISDSIERLDRQVSYRRKGGRGHCIARQSAPFLRVLSSYFKRWINPPSGNCLTVSRFALFVPWTLSAPPLLLGNDTNWGAWCRWVRGLSQDTQEHNLWSPSDCCASPCKYAIPSRSCSSA